MYDMLSLNFWSSKVQVLPSYFRLSSTATATETVMPTMGLLPAPRKPIISTRNPPCGGFPPAAQGLFQEETQGIAKQETQHFCRNDVILLFGILPHHLFTKQGVLTFLYTSIIIFYHLQESSIIPNHLPSSPVMFSLSAAILLSKNFFKYSFYFQTCPIIVDRFICIIRP